MTNRADPARYAHLRVISRSLAQHLYKPCPYCGRKMEGRPLNVRPTRDHVYPKSKLGSTKIIICCTRCNHDKGALWLEEWLAKLVAANDPRVPFVEEVAKRFPSERVPSIYKNVMARQPLIKRIEP